MPIKEAGWVDLFIDTMHIKDPFVFFGSEGSARSLPLNLLSSRIIARCHCSHNNDNIPRNVSRKFVSFITGMGLFYTTKWEQDIGCLCDNNAYNQSLIMNSQRRTYGVHPLPHRPLVTPGPCVSLCSLSPHTFVMNVSCIRSVPSPVLLSYTYTLLSLWSVSSLSFCPTHIFKPPQKRTPQTSYVNSFSQ